MENFNNKQVTQTEFFLLPLSLLLKKKKYKVKYYKLQSLSVQF